ncbi:putative branched-chain-amino-acid transaminase, partial [Cooperia oncophora]
MRQKLKEITIKSRVPVRRQGCTSYIITVIDISAASGKVPTFYHNDLRVTQLEPEKRKPLPKKELGFGNIFSQHMFEVDWSSEGEVIYQFQVLHYATELFEGMKAYRGDDDRIRLFRPQLNMERMRRTARRAALPDFDGDELLKCILELVRVDQAWVPKEKGAALYVRPTLIGTEPGLGVLLSNKAKLFVITSPVGAYFKHGFKPIKLLADAKFVRAAKGGVGAFKMGSNYAPTLGVAAAEAETNAASWSSQGLWLSEKNSYVTEAGAMNVFLHWKNEQGEDELITPSLESGLILPGVTRHSILELAREMGKVKVTERDFTMEEFRKAAKENRIYEFFGSGTAVVVSPVDKILYKIDGRA